MHGRNRTIALVVVMALALGGAALHFAGARVGPGSPRLDGAFDSAASQPAPSFLPEGEIRERNIAFFEQRVREDSGGATDRRMLAALYMGRARAMGSVNDYTRAETLLRASLSIREQRNSETFALLASALLARHDFTGAL
ncbi:MAG: hypothetical protein ABIT38_07670, partial [Gemmatimonadaceae bacterium]